MKRGLVRAIVGLGLGGLVLGPWPSRLEHPLAYTRKIWFRDTQARLALATPLSGHAEWSAGAARVDLDAPHPVCLAGHPGGMGQIAAAAPIPISARALTLANGPSVVTVVNADLLLVNETLARAVAARSGVDRSTLFFTATHTHTGPGGWGLHPLERLVAGTYDPTEASYLADRLAEAVIRSRRHLVAAEVAFVTVPCPGMQTNRIEPREGTNDVLSAWIVRTRARRDSGRTLATLATFGAHATIAGGDPPRFDGDYPTAFAQRLAERVDAGIVLFAAGTVGDSAPVRPQGIGSRMGATRYGERLAEALGGVFASAQFRTSGPLVNFPLPVDLPPVRVSMGTPTLQFSPLATWWVGSRRTHLHLLRIGPATLVGFPGDVAGHLVTRLRAANPVVATSFNGDYKGYLVSRDTYLRRSCYETRWMSFFGPDLGESLAALAQASLDRVAALSNAAPSSTTKPPSF